jgi:integrase
MARPRTSIGTYGTIKITLIAEKAKGKPAIYEARARIRMASGRMRRCRKRGSTETKATAALKDHMANLGAEATKKGVSGATRFAHVADLWLKDLERKVAKGTRAAKTHYDYRDTVNNYVTRQLGELSCNEVSVTTCDDRIKEVHDQVGFASAKRLKVVLSGICAYGVRHGATFAGGQSLNPVKLSDTVEQDKGRKEPIRVLEPEQRADFLKKLRAFTDEKAQAKKLGPRARSWTDLPDIAELMLATGTRLGEILAVIGDDVDPSARTVVVDHHLVRIERKGMQRVPLRKGDGEALTLVFPTWAAPLFRRRKLAAGGGLLFPAWNGELVDPSNVGKRFRAACDEIGYPWVASHVFRHTVGTHLGDKDVAPTAIGDQLGNSAVVVEANYRRKRVANRAVADHLESILNVDEDAG